MELLQLWVRFNSAQQAWQAADTRSAAPLPAFACLLCRRCPRSPGARSPRSEFIGASAPTSAVVTRERVGCHTDGTQSVAAVANICGRSASSMAHHAADNAQQLDHAPASSRCSRRRAGVLSSRRCSCSLPPVALALLVLLLPCTHAAHVQVNRGMRDHLRQVRNRPRRRSSRSSRRRAAPPTAATAAPRSLRRSCR